MMKPEGWDTMSRAERERVRQPIVHPNITPDMVGWRVEVVDREPFDGKPRRFIVGQSTGWAPCYLEIARRNCLGGMAAASSYKSVVKLYRVRG